MKRELGVICIRALMMKTGIVVLFTSLLYSNVLSAEIIESCDSPIYCKGSLLDTLQKARLYNDSKSFVDLTLVHSADETLEIFDNLMKNTSNNPSKEDLIKFRDDNFVSAGGLEDWTPTDFNKDPEFLSRVNDEEVREFARSLVGIWPKLGRKVKQEVLDHPDRTSLIGVPNGFIVPGGRFLETYYWDSYWIIKGLLVSEMTTTVQGILENFFSIVDKYGFIPNGLRVYYLNRSQPPLLTFMVNEYIKATKNFDWLKEHIQTIENELNFFLKNRTIEVEFKGQKVKLAHYYVASNTPRPESYREDVATCDVYTDENKKLRCFQELKAGAESGLDFTTRWFYESENGHVNLSNVQTSRNIPVDLNAYLQGAFAILADFYKQLENPKKSAEWQANADLWKKNIELVLYDEEDGIWYDLDKETGEHIKRFYPSNFAPLWSESYDEEKRSILGERAADYFYREGVNQYQGGIPASLINSGEQWDFPNAWPPLQDLVITGLHKSGGPNATELADTFARRWVKSNLRGYGDTNEMFEKYDAENPGQYGGGGEYVVQSGFGWTNGVALSFINTYYTDSKN